MVSELNTQWLDAPQQVIWRNFLAANAVISERMDTALRPFGLDLGEYEILVVLSESPKMQLRMSDLAVAVHQSRSRLTHTVTRMEQKDLLLRKACADDRRGVIAVLTAKGFRLLEEAAPTHVGSVREAFVDLVAPNDFQAVGRAVAAVVEDAGLSSWSPSVPA
ncbi:MAG: MarR family transcriptional regulator [Propionibacteriaceae bacterium]|mgnify:CR=1 FL=1|nr:MarR family transcriptional regulator [Micropruina sp.]HBX82908.1 MarR family transcriptional regulator [Propionibacteriaceae bacterium]